MRFRPVFLLLLLGTLSPRATRALVPARGVRDMARIPAGSYRPLYAAHGASRIHVAAFAIDRYPVTRGDFLHFVQSHPRWARGAVPASLAEAGYLADWPSAVAVGSATDARRPVVNVSRLAAEAYCAAQGKRLPTVAEWERAAAASTTMQDATGDPRFRRELVALYAERVPGAPVPVGGSRPNVFGVSDLHGVVWEWTIDPHAAMLGHCASAAISAVDPLDYPAFQRYAVRGGLTARSTVSGVGFRCAA